MLLFFHSCGPLYKYRHRQLNCLSLWEEILAHRGNSHHVAHPLLTLLLFLSSIYSSKHDA